MNQGDFRVILADSSGDHITLGYAQTIEAARSICATLQDWYEANRETFSMDAEQMEIYQFIPEGEEAHTILRETHHII